MALKPFEPGQSGNPGGRPKGLGRHLREKYGEDAKKVVEALHRLAFGKKEPAQVRLNALKELLDRGWGKAPQTVQLGGGISVEDKRGVLRHLSDSAVADLAARVAFDSDDDQGTVQ